MESNSGTIQIRHSSIVWFAAGIAVTLIAAAVFVGTRAGAATADDESTFVPITPCRLFDTRPGIDNIGPRSTPIGPDETHVQKVTGTNGNCTVPAGATGVSLNVTAVSPTAPSFMTIFPSNATRPLVSNLNFLPGSPPTPNKVDVALSPSGRASFYNLAGDVHTIADISGYYTSAGLSDLQDQIADVRDDIDANRSWTGEIALNGSKVGQGPFTSSRSSDGIYVVRFQVADDHPPARYSPAGPLLYPTVQASVTCAAHTVAVWATTGTLNAQDEWTELDIHIRTFDGTGATSNCGFYLTAAIPKPTPPAIIMPL